MGDRFLLSGVQIGMIIGYINAKRYDDACDLISTLSDTQTVGDSSDLLLEDVQKVKVLFKGGE